MNETAQRLRQLLFNSPPHKSLSAELKAALVVFAQAIYGDSQWLAAVKYGRFVSEQRPNVAEYSFKLRDQEIPTILNAVEANIPVQLLGLDLSGDELEAAQRMITMVMLACEHHNISAKHTLLTEEGLNRGRVKFAVQLASVGQIDSAVLMRAFLDFGSETPCNLNCYQHVEYGSVGQIVGLKIVGKPILLSHITRAIESVSQPPYLRENFPNLTDQEWLVCLRMATLLICSLENE